MMYRSRDIRTHYWDAEKLVLVDARGLDHSRCWVCGSRDDVVAYTRTFHYTPGWVLIGLLLGLVPILFTYLLGRRKKQVELPICGPCEAS